MAALPRQSERDFTSVCMNIKVFIRPPINAHIPMYAARYRSACALPLNLIWGFETTSKPRLRKKPTIAWIGALDINFYNNLKIYHILSFVDFTGVGCYGKFYGIRKYC
jgi:hypothetical protein